MAKSFLFLAEGFEEIEALATVDVLRRGGIDVLTVSIKDHKSVRGAHGVTVEADLTFKEADFDGSDWLILPGGMPGASNLHNFAALNDLLKVHHGRIAAICASPSLVLGPTGLLEGKPATCYPGMEADLVAGGADYRPTEKVVKAGRIITAYGPGATIDFALTIVAETMGDERAKQVREGMLA